MVVAPAAPMALLGWAILGAGLAAIAAVTTLGYLGSFTGPPLVGALAELTGLSTALVLLVTAAVLPALLARRALGPSRA